MAEPSPKTSKTPIKLNAANEAIPTPNEPAPTHGQKVLLIEDSESFALVLKTQIETNYGYTTIICKSLQETKETLEQRADEFFIAVVDLHLPDAQDGEALDVVLDYDIATVVYTGKFSDALREDILNKGITDYVLKTGRDGLEYVPSLVNRIYLNFSTKVMVVDDSRIARRAMCRLLQTQRFQILQAASGPEALEMLAKNPDIRIALLDCYMDPMDGFTLASQIRQTHSKEELSIIGVSSQGSQALSAKFIKSGANDFLVKPFMSEEFNCRINQSANFVDQFHALRKSNEQKNTWLGIAAHDIRGPLGIIQSVSELLLKKELKPERRNQIYEMINENSVHMLDLLNNLLEISAIESGKFSIKKSAYNLNDLINQRVTLYNNLAEEKDQQLICQLEDCPNLEIDAIRISQALDNLITNAIKYSPMKSKITIQLSRETNSVKLTVLDQGPGVTKEEESLLFGTFQRTSNATTGGEKSTGLGLAICKTIIEGHGGTVGYKPNPEGGSCFILTLPTED